MKARCSQFLSLLTVFAAAALCGADAAAPAPAAPAEAPKKRGRPRKRLQEIELDEEPDDEAVESFFSEVGAECASSTARSRTGR